MPSVHSSQHYIFLSQRALGNPQISLDWMKNGIVKDQRVFSHILERIEGRLEEGKEGRNKRRKEETEAGVLQPHLCCASRFRADFPETLPCVSMCMCILEMGYLFLFLIAYSIMEPSRSVGILFGVTLVFFFFVSLFGVNIQK